MFYKTQIKVLFILLLSSVETPVVAQAMSGDPVSYTFEAPEAVNVGDEFVITVVFNIEPGWYVYAPIEMNIALGKISTKVTFKVPKGFKKLNRLQLPNEDNFFDTYSGNNVRMSQKFQVKKSTLSGTYSIASNLIYQTCNDDICYPPVRKKIDITINVE